MAPVGKTASHIYSNALSNQRSMPTNRADSFGGQVKGAESEMISDFDRMSLGGAIQNRFLLFHGGIKAAVHIPPPRMALSPGRLVKQEPTHKEVNLLLSLDGIKPNSSYTGTPKYKSETMPAFATETIQNLRLRLKNSGVFTGRHHLVLGDRELATHEAVDQVASQNGMSDYFHIFARLSDVSSLEVSTERRTVILDNQRKDAPRLPTSLLSQGLALKEDSKPGADNSLMLRGRFVGYGDAVEEVMDRSVIHLLIRKSAKVEWKNVKDDCFEMSVGAMDTVATIKRKIEQVSSIATDKYRFLCDGEVLTPSMPLASCGIKKGSVLELIPYERTRLRTCHDGLPRLSNPNHKLFQHWKAAKDALAQGVAPKLAPAGTGGSYFIFANDGTKVAVFKPEDEEPNGPNNPKGYAGSPDGGGLRKGVRPGEGATREIIAYMLDHGGFSGVPPTAMVSLKGMDGDAAKVGSFQQFIPHDVDCEEMGPSVFPVHEVHKIAVLDIRLANTDRNASNILARHNLQDATWELTPIDHGYCLPSTFEDINFEWQYWPQAKIPFSETTLNYIEGLDCEQDLLILAEQGLSLRRECERVFKVCTLLLQKAAKKGLTLFQIGNILTRETSEKSPIEKMHMRAIQLAVQEEYGEEPVGACGSWICSDDVYMKYMNSIIDQYLDEVSLKSDNGTTDVFFGEFRN